MNSALMFSKASDEWETPVEVFDPLCAEFGCTLDVAATIANRKCERYFGLDHVDPAWRDALAVSWADVAACCWMNPPYTHCGRFIAKAVQEAQAGCTVVALVPSRTCTRWWHQHIWSGSQPRPGVEVRFLKGRIKFLPRANSAPFPSVVLVFRPRVAKGCFDASRVTCGSDQDDEPDRPAAVDSPTARAVHGAVTRDPARRLDIADHACGDVSVEHRSDRGLWLHAGRDVSGAARHVAPVELTRCRLS